MKISSVQSLSRVQLFVTPRTAACQASLSIPNSWSLLKLMSIKLVMLSNHIILCCPFFLLPSIFPSIRFPGSQLFTARWPKYWSFSFSISPSSEYSGLTSLRIDWFDLLAVQGTLKNLLQQRSSKASILWCSASILTYVHDYWKTIPLTRWTFVAKYCLLFPKKKEKTFSSFLARGQLMRYA